MTNECEYNLELGERSHCPLGLEVNEEHVLLPSSARNSPAFHRKLGGHSRSSSIASKVGCFFLMCVLCQLWSSGQGMCQKVQGSNLAKVIGGVRKVIQS